MFLITRASFVDELKGLVYRNRQTDSASQNKIFQKNQGYGKLFTNPNSGNNYKGYLSTLRA